MRPIVAPIRFGESGEAVENLIRCLMFLMDRGAAGSWMDESRMAAMDRQKWLSEAHSELKNSVFSTATRKLVLEFQLRHKIGGPPRGNVDAKTAARLNALLKENGMDLDGFHQIAGRVADEAGRPQAGICISAWDRDLRIHQPLGEVVQTDAGGNYLITYKPEDFARADAPDRKVPWLIVEARMQADGEVLTRVEVKPDRVQPEQTVDLVLPGTAVSALDEWQQICNAVLPLLAGQGSVQPSSPATHVVQRDLFPSELNADDLDFIVQETGVNRFALVAWVAASRMVQDIFHLLSEAAPERLDVPREAGWPYAYAMARQGLGLHLDAVLHRTSDEWSRAWAAALKANQVPKLGQKLVTGMQSILELMQKLRQLDVNRSADSPLAQVLAISPVPISSEIAMAALPLLQQEGVSNPDALLQLHETYPKESEAVNALVRGLRIHQLVGGHAGLMQELSARLDGGTDTIEPLARWTLGEWTEVAEKTGWSVAKVLPVQVRLEAQHPLVALESRLSGGVLALSESVQKEIGKLAQSQGSQVEALLQGKTSVIDKQELSEGEHVLKNLGVYGRLGLSMELAAYLIQAGASTPAVALQYGREHLRETIRGKYDDVSLEIAVDAFRDRIERYMEGGREISISTGNAYMVPPGMYAVPDPLPAEVRENLPTIPGLFGDLDECACRSCESMLGQPAYLVDLLELLRKKPSKKAPAPLDALQERRPQIFTLELSCDNAEGLIQHIDLVLEILEEAAGRMAGGDAYERLALEGYPWALPFHRQRAQAHAYLSRLGLRRAELLWLFRGWLEPESWAAELLDVPYESGHSVEWSRLTVDRPGSGRRESELWELYGLVDAFGRVSISDPVTGEDLGGRPVEDVARRISVLLDRTGLDLDAFEALIATDYVGRWSITNRAQCKTSAMSLGSGTTSLRTCLNRIYRLVRLSRKLPAWSLAELDLAMTQGQGGSPLQDKDLVVRLAMLNRLAERHRFPVASLLALPGSMDAVCARIGLRPGQAVLLQRMAGWRGAVAPVDWDVFERLLLLRERLDQCGLTVEEAACAFLPRAELESLLQPQPAYFKTRQRIDDFLANVQLRLRAVTVTSGEGAASQQVQELLTEVLGPNDAASVMRAIEDAGAAEAVPLEAGRLDRVVALLSAASSGARGLGQWQPLLSSTDAAALLAVTGSANPSADERYTSLLGHVLPQRRERTLVRAVSELAGLTEAEAVSVLTDRLLLDELANAPRQALQLFLSAPASSGAVDARLWDWADRLHRFLALRTKLGAIPFDTVAPRIDWRHALAAEPATSSWPEQQALLDWIWLAGDERLSVPTLGATFDALDAGPAPALEQVIQPLARRLELADTRVRDIAALAGLSDADAFRKADKMVRLHELLLLAKKLGADADQLSHLVVDGDPASLAVLRSVTQAALKLDATGWPAMQQKIEDPVRRQRRDALVAYLLSRNTQWRDANALYEHYLIDPLVDPCMQTTRVLEAISATQLFAQRVLFGLESGIQASPVLQEQWTWMRSYRVWEANRKVYLFPENWLYSELRDDKSSSFKLLESALGQGELNAELAEEAYGKFLDDVAQMGRVQVLGMYEDVEFSGAMSEMTSADEEDVPRKRDLYVIGRTANQPYAYYWRKCTDFGSRWMEWSPWQLIELDIQGDHVLPFVLNGDFHLAWPQIKRVENMVQGGPGWSVRMCWSRFDGRSWRRMEVSRDVVEMGAEPFIDDRTGFTFRGRVSPDETFEAVGYVASPPDLSIYVPQTSATRYDLISWERQSDGYLFDWWNWVYRAYATSGLKVRAKCWVKLSYAGGTREAHVEVGGSVPAAVRLRCVETGWTGYVPGGIFQSWGSDAQPRLTFTIEGSIAGIPLSAANQITLPAVQTTDEIPAKTFADIELRFVIDATQSTAMANAFGVGTSTKFNPQLIFTLDRSGQVSINRDFDRVAPPPLVPLSKTTPWMNGYREQQVNETDPSRFAIELPARSSGALLWPFDSSGDARFWALPGNSGRQFVESPGVWYVAEDDRGIYIDLPQSMAVQQKLRLFPDSFRESASYRAGWKQSTAYDLLPLQSGSFDAQTYPPVSAHVEADTWTAARDGQLTFDSRAPYAIYNWEVFFHAPLRIADQLSRQHKFEEAERWLRYVFDPTSTSAGADARRFLKFRVLRELDTHRQGVDDLKALAQVASGFYTEADVGAVEKLIQRWRAAPFRPFVIARGRHIAFLWRTLFAYLDNLLAWADSLYRQDTRESNNEAMMLYVLARKILGRRPQRHQGKSVHPAMRYVDLQGKLDAFSNFWIDVGSRGPSRHHQSGRLVLGRPASSDGMLLFCMPFNDKLETYWNTVEDRLFNLRHCRNIEGMQRDLPLTEAPIDPELLVRVTAAGLDLGSVINGLYAPAPQHRYGVLAARAAELANEVKALGAAMLAALEKFDAEQLAQLRSTHEIGMLKLASEVRKLQISEAQRNLEALRASRASIQTRYSQYQRLIGKKTEAPAEGASAGVESMLGEVGAGSTSQRSALGLIKEEEEQYVGIDGANTWSTASTIAKVVGSTSQILASGAFAIVVDIPNKAGMGLQALGGAASMTGDAFAFVAQGWRTYAEHQGMLGGHLRRRDEWAFQSNQALKELQQIDKQILAAEIRLQISMKELDNHTEQMEQARAVDEVMRSKFTNAQLYDWMSKELYGLLDRTYRLALDMAHRAERAAARELGVTALNVIGNDHWNSMRQGLLAGEKLHHELKQLEVTYLDQNRREFELTKHISLRRLDPEALVELRVTQREGNVGLNQCEFEIPEWLFDLDTPGHYLRRIKSVSVSIPCVTGPYTSVHCKLTQLSNHIRHDKLVDGGYARADEDLRFTDYYGASDAIVTSTAGSDSGLFEAQLRDERFLPFEGSGVISRWRLELPGEYRQFDYATISDVVLTIRYTARDGGDSLRDSATAAIRTIPEPQRKPLNVLLSCRSDFPTEWAASLGGHGAMTLALKPELLPYWMTAARLSIGAVGYQDIRGAAAVPITFTPVQTYQQGGGSVTLPGVTADLADRLVLLRLGFPAATS
jgi:hypothetical protein